MNRWPLPEFIRRKLEGRQALQGIIANTGWLFADRIIRMGIGLLVSVWVARYLGPSQFGLLNFATAFVALFAAFSTLGLDGIVVRELVRHPDDRREILGSAIFLRLAGSLVTIVSAAGIISLLRQGEELPRLMVMIISIGTLFQTLDVIDFWFQSRVLSKYTVMAKNGAFIIAAFLKAILILRGAPLIFFAWAALLELVLAAAGLVFFYRRNGGRIREWLVRGARCRSLLADSWPLILSGLSIAVYMKIDLVMLGKMAGDQAVGIYSAATKMSEVWYFIPMAIVSSIFPSVIRAREKDESLYYRRMQRLFSFMAALSFSIAVPMTFLASLVVVPLFGEQYAAAGPVLAVHIWASLFVFYGVAQSPWDLAENLTRLALFRMAFGAIINVALNIILIPAYGVMGAAVATVISQAFSSVILNLIHPRTREIFYLQVKGLFFLKALREI
ncbi:flippase [Geobacter sp. DSM 9736]|uniref:flippase n=1 Tax=Geobacter sp. DSM 9736 TaxID=1277350 RepID=UPI000B511505|nr:flippase [Geobacter sp. DSM 9736]SNB46606.1 polysaccharide transporter, PST family [Geobacter sp. DSM 9736]